MKDLQTTHQHDQLAALTAEFRDISNRLARWEPVSEQEIQDYIRRRDALLGEP